MIETHRLKNVVIFIQIIQSDIFELSQKLHYYTITLLHFHLSFWIWKMWKGKKNRISREQTELF